MYWISWVFVGFLAGWLTGRMLVGEGYGRFMDIAMGVGGAVVGGFLMRTVELSGYAGRILVTLAAIIGAVLFTTAAALVTGRRLHTPLL